MCLSINTNTWSYIVVLLAYLYDIANIPIRPKDKKKNGISLETTFKRIGKYVLSIKFKKKSQVQTTFMILCRPNVLTVNNSLHLMLEK